MKKNLASRKLSFIFKFTLCFVLGTAAFFLTGRSIEALAAQQVSGEEDQELYKDEYGGIHTANGFVYKLYDDIYDPTYSVRYEGTAESIVIPDRFKGLEVRSLFSGAFSDAPNLKSVTLPESMSEIDDGAFMDCKNLEEILVDEKNLCYTVQEGVLYELGDSGAKRRIVFCPLKNIKAFAAPESVEWMDSYAFWECKELQSVYIPASVQKIGSAFQFAGLQNVYYGSGRDELEDTKEYYDFSKTVEKAHLHFNFNPEDYQSSLLSDQTAEISGYWGTDSELSVPAGLGNTIVSSIGTEAFSGCRSVVHADIPDSVVRIGDRAFEGCSALERIVVPAGVTFVGADAFNGCFSLREIYYAGSEAQWNRLNVQLTDEVKIIYNCNPHEFFPGHFSESETRIMYYTGDREDIVIPSWLDGRQMTAIGDGYTRLFADASPKRIEILEGITQIDRIAFSGCKSVQEVRLPDTCIEIGEEAFASCEGLEKITLSPNLEKMGEKSFFQCKSLSGEISFPEKLTYIPISAFEDCEKLNGVTLPENLIEINSYAFSGCKSLTSVSLPKSLNYMGISVFWGCSSLKDVYYSGTGKEWKNFTLSGSFNKAGNDCLLNAGFHYTEEDLGVPSGSFTVTFNAWGTADIPPQTILQFGHVKKPADPVRPDYIFIGWYYGEELWDFEFDRIRGDMTLQAKWTYEEEIRQNGKGEYIDAEGFVLIPLGKEFIVNGGAPAYSSNITYNWQIDKPMLMQMGRNGDQSIPVKGLAEGQCTLTCTVRSEHYRVPPFGTEPILYDVDTSNYPYKYRIVPLIKSLRMSEKSITMKPGAYHFLTVTAAPSNSGYARVLSGLTFASSDPSVAEVSKDGILTARKNGTVTVTAFTENGMDGITGRDSCTVTVTDSVSAPSAPDSGNGETDKNPGTAPPASGSGNGNTDKDSPDSGPGKDGSEEKPGGGTKEIPVKKITLSAKQIYMVKGKSIRIGAYVSPANATDELKWSTSNKKIAVVKNGKITAKKTGKVSVTVRAGKKKASLNVVVVPKAKKAAKVTLKKKSSMKVKSSLLLKASVSPKNATDTLTWSSSNKKIAKVDKFGRVTALKKGKATIRVKTSSGKKASCRISVIR